MPRSPKPSKAQPAGASPPPAVVVNPATLLKLLRALEPSGPDGFEGWVADALSELTGRAFRLMKPGPQGGADLLSDAAAGEALVAVEAKRFREATQLSLDLLLAKLADLDQTRPEVDLWILAATRQVSADDAAKLEASGSRYGLDVLVMDTRPGADGLSPLEILSAAAPRAAASHFPNRPDLHRHLEAIRSNPRFAVALGRLQRRLSSPEIGYDAARTAMARRLRGAMADLGTAKCELGSHADLLAGGGQPGVDRAGAAAHMSAAVSDPSQLRAVLGGEGMGKTWAILRWWNATAGPHGLGLPFTVWLPAARIASGGDLVAAVCAVLAERTGTRNPDFWRARLGRWRRADGVRLLLVVDGLNQNFLFKRWSDLLQPFFGREWRGKVAVAVTCRPDHWAQLGDLADLVPKPATLTMAPFDDPELDSMLGLHGLSRDAVPEPLLALLRVPRLFSLGVRMLRDPDGMGEPTPETLALADWRDRVGLHGNRIGLRADEFRNLVSNLGLQLKNALAGGSGLEITRSQLLAELGRDSGYGPQELAGAVSELVDGRWLRSTDPHRFRLEGAPAHLAMGLSLLDVLRSKGDAAAAADAIADFTDPLRGADIGVAVLRAASTAALVEAGTPAPVRRALLLAWLQSQNFSRTDFGAFWRLIGLDPALFVRLADEGWRSRRFDAREDEVMAKALANASRWEGVATAVDAAVRSWMSAVPLTDASESAAGARAALDALRSAGLPGAALLHAETDMDGWLSACRNALVICSFRKRAPVANAYAAWGLAGALAGNWTHGDMVEWTLRLNEEDPAEAGAAIIEAGRGLLASGNAHARAAAGQLLRAHAARPAMELLVQDGDEAMTGDTGLPTASPSNSVETTLTPDEVVALGAMAGTVSASPAPTRVAALIEFCHSAPVEALIGAFSDGVTQGIVPALARWAPCELDPCMRRVADAAAEAVRPNRATPRWLVDVSERAPGLAGFLSAGTRDALAAACNGLSLPRRPHWTAGTAATALACYDRTPEEQMEVLAGAFPVGLTKAARLVLAPLPPDAVLRAAREKAAERPEAECLAHWLQLLNWSRELDRLPLPDPVAPFLELTGHADAKVRTLAMSLLHDSLDCEAVAVKFAARGWHWSEGMDREEAGHGSLLLLEAMPSLGWSVLDRADPQVAVAAFAKDPHAVGRLTALLRREVEHILDRVSHSSGRLWCRQDTLDDFVRCEPDEAKRLVRPAMSPGRSRSTFLFMGFPALGLCQGLLRHRPEVGAALWRSLMDEQEDGMPTRSDLALMPFRVPRSETIDALREHALSRARDDAAISRLAGAATLDEADCWLHEVITRDLDSPSAGIAACALMLAGSTHATPRARALWSGRLADPPVPGWLAAVHAAARDAFRRNLDALHWFDAFLRVADPVDAWSAYALFASRADGRSFKRGGAKLGALCPNVPALQRLRWNLDVADAGERGQRRHSEQEKLYAATPRTPGLGPWG